MVLEYDNMNQLTLFITSICLTIKIIAMVVFLYHVYKLQSMHI